MSDIEAAVKLVESGKLSTDQLVQLHSTGQLRPLPGQGVRLMIIGSVPGFTDELATFHESISHELVRRGLAAYA